MVNRTTKLKVIYMNIWLIWHSLAMAAVVGVSFTAGFFTCRVFASKALNLKTIKK